MIWQDEQTGFRIEYRPSIPRFYAVRDITAYSFPTLQQTKDFIKLVGEGSDPDKLWYAMWDGYKHE